MSYVNVSLLTIDPWQKYVSNHFVTNTEADCTKKELLSRACYLGLAPTAAIISIVDTAIGAVSGVATIATGSCCREVYEFTFQHLRSSRQLLASPYRNLLKTFNPEAVINEKIETENSSGVKSMVVANGFITHEVQSYLKKMARNYYQSDDGLEKHVASRLTYFVLAIASIITRVVDGIIGILAAIASFVILGSYEPLNNLAYRGLQTTGLIEDLFFCTIKILYPRAGI